MRIIGTFLAAAALAVSALAEVGAPAYWYRFEGNLRSSGSSALVIDPAASVDNYYTHSQGGSAYLTIRNVMPSASGLGKDRMPYGTGLSHGDTYTIAASIRSSERANAVNPLFSIGDRSTGALVLAADGPDAVQLGEVQVSASSKKYVKLVRAEVEKATRRFHHYAITVNGDTVTLYVDGQAAGEAVTKTVSPKDGFCWGSLSGGLDGVSGLSPSSGVAIDDWRVYTTELAAADIAALAAEFPVWPTSTVVAKIGENGYETLAKAAAEVGDGGVIELVADTWEGAITSTHSCTIRSTPGKRYTVTFNQLTGKGVVSGADNVKVGLENVIFTSSLDRSFSESISTTDAYAIGAYGGGREVTLGPGCVFRDCGWGASANGRVQVQAQVRSGGSLVMEEGSLIEHMAAVNHVLYVRESGATLTMNGGTIRGCYSTNNGAPITLYEDSTANLNGGLISGCNSSAAAAAAVNMDYRGTTAKAEKVNLNGTEFRDNPKGDLSVYMPGNVSVLRPLVGNITVKYTSGGGQSISGIADGVQIAKLGEGVSLSGPIGTFTGTSGNDWHASAEDGVVVWRAGTCRVANTDYTSLSAACAAAGESGEVTLLGDYRNGESLSLSGLRLTGVGGVRSITATVSSTAKITVGSRVVLDGIRLSSSVNRVTPLVAIGDLSELVLTNGSSIADVRQTSGEVITLGSSTHKEARLTMCPGTSLRNLFASTAPIAASPKWAVVEVDGATIENCGSLTTTSSGAAVLHSQQGGLLRLRRGGRIANCRTAKFSGMAVFTTRKGSATFEVLDGEVSGCETGSLITPTDSCGNIVLRLGANAVLSDNGLVNGEMAVERDRGAALVFVDDAYAGAPVGVKFSYTPNGEHPIRFVGSCKNGEKIVFLDAEQATYRRVKGDLVAYGVADAEFPDFAWSLNSEVGTDDLSVVNERIKSSMSTDRVSSAVMLKDITLDQVFTFSGGQIYQIIDGNGHTLNCTGTGKELFTGMRSDSKVWFRNVTLRHATGLQSLIDAGIVKLDDSVSIEKMNGLILLFK